MRARVITRGGVVSFKLWPGGDFIEQEIFGRLRYTGQILTWVLTATEDESAVS